MAWTMNSGDCGSIPPKRSCDLIVTPAMGSSKKHHKKKKKKDKEKKRRARKLGWHICCIGTEEGLSRNLARGHEGGSSIRLSGHGNILSHLSLHYFSCCFSAFHLYLPTKDTMQKSKQHCIPAAQHAAAAQQYADGASQPPWLGARLAESAESAEPWQLNVGHWVFQEESSEKV